MELILLPPWVHTAFECLAFFAAGRLFWSLRKRQTDLLTFEQRLWVIAGCTFGALLGAKLIFLLDNPAFLASHPTPNGMMSGGKGIVGALAGGWLGVELVKKLMHIQTRTGDLFVYPLILGIILGRIGCFLTGFYDQTYGNPTSLPWAVDFGDGVFRHPTQLYEILFLVGLWVYVRARLKQPAFPGEIFRIFIFSYSLFRFGVDFIKPTPHLYWDMNANQIASLLMMAFSFPKTRFWISALSAERSLTP